MKHNSKRSEARRNAASPRYILLILSAFALYTSMMASKAVYVAEISHITEMLGIDKATASVSNTCYFVAYAAMQVALFFFFGKISVNKYVALTVPLSALSLMLMPLSPSIEVMWVAFALAGLFQAGVYSSCNHALAKYLPSALLSRANALMSFGFAAGTALAYLLSAVCIGIGLWWLPFVIMGILLTLSTVGFVLSSRGCAAAAETEPVTLTDEEPFISLDTPRRRAIFYTLALLLVFLSSSLYYAVMNWLAVMLEEVHGLGGGISLYITVLVPALLFLGPLAMIRLSDRERNLLKVGLLSLTATLPLSLLLALFYRSGAILAFLLSALFLIAINGIRMIGVSIVPFKMRKTLPSAEYSAISNATASLAGGIAPTIAGLVIDKGGWQDYYLALFALLAATVIMAAVIYQKTKAR